MRGSSYLAAVDPSVLVFILVAVVPAVLAPARLLQAGLVGFMQSLEGGGILVRPVRPQQFRVGALDRGDVGLAVQPEHAERIAHRHWPWARRATWETRKTIQTSHHHEGPPVFVARGRLSSMKDRSTSPWATAASWRKVWMACSWNW